MKNSSAKSIINFSKMHGLGNDFMVIDGIRQKFQPTAALVQRWADRHTGIGFDQLLLIEPSRNKETDFFYRIFNADGGEVAQCGNGARCIARFLHDEKLSSKNPLIVETLAGNLEIVLEKDQQVTVAMGIPNFEPNKIPFLTERKNTTYFLAIGDKTAEFCALSLGNPHCVLLVDEVKQAPVLELGPLLSKHHVFPQESNVSFMQIVDPTRIKLRVFERGADETLACGSGACAAVVAGRTLGLLAESVTVEQLGGELKVSWQGDARPVYLTGPATHVFKGTIEVIAE